MAATMATACALMASPAEFKKAGDWLVQVTYNGKTDIMAVEPPVVATVENERHDKLQDYVPNRGGWVRGNRLKAILAMECSTYGGYCHGTLTVKSSDKPDAVIYADGIDYKLTEDWGTVGRLPEGRITPEQPVFVDYAYTLHRIDSVILDAEGNITLKQGKPHSATPLPPTLEQDETLLGNLWIKAGLDKLTEEQFFPVLENAFPEEENPTLGTAATLLPKTCEKLKNGETLRILAWGDSVTDGTFLPDFPATRWQERFLEALKKQFPQANIQMETVAWGGRNTDDFLNEPPGSQFNYEERVLGAKADLIVSEFVNDAGFTSEHTERNYTKFRNDFAAAGAEWIIITPHYIRPEMMGLNREKDIDDDPRPHVKTLRKIAAEYGIPLADASLRWGRLWRQGIPFSSRMMNCINHPTKEGMTLFVDALTSLFANITPDNTQKLMPVQFPEDWPTDNWYGFKRHHFTVDGCPAWVVEPESPQPDHRWSWTPQWAESFVERVGTIELLKHGFYHAFVDVFKYRCSPKGIEVMNHFQDILVDMGLSPKANLIGMSWGGFFSLRYAMENPERVQAIYLDAPVCDAADNHPSALDRLQTNMELYGMTREELEKADCNPINAAQRLVKANIPIFATVSDSDDVVIPARNFNRLEKSLKEAGATIIPLKWGNDGIPRDKVSNDLQNVKGPRVFVYHRPMWGHHPHGFQDPTPCLIFHTRSRK